MLVSERCGIVEVRVRVTMNLLLGLWGLRSTSSKGPREAAVLPRLTAEGGVIVL
jgi:hypothetical protein